MAKILIVDDVRDLADSTAEMLRLLGHETRTAYNGREAIAAVDADRPDMVLLDLHMPLCDGFEAAREIRTRHPSPTPLIIAVSALAGPQIARRLQDCGFDDYVTKPADVVSLVALMEARP